MAAEAEQTGCGPLIAAWTGAGSSPARSLRLQVFERIRAAGLVPRVQLARDLNVSPASVTTITSELIEAGLVVEMAGTRTEAGRGEAGRGRPAVGLSVRGQAHCVMGVKLSDRENTAVVADFAGRILASDAMEREPGPVPLPELLDQIAALVDRAAARAGLARGDLSALGIGVPGFVDHQAGMVYWSSVLAAGGVALAEAAAARLALPVVIDNDANLVALAELWFGAGRTLSDFAVVTIEHGVGMGFVMDHRLYRGAQRLGLELGHTKVQLDGALCRCGQRGCLEAYLADYALAREAVTALHLNHQRVPAVPVLLQSLFDAARGGNATARGIFRRAGRYLALGLANVVNMLDPALIILSGERMTYDYLYDDDTLAEMADLVIPSGRPRPPIEVHAWGDLLWAHGAAALALQQVTERTLS